MRSQTVKGEVARGGHNQRAKTSLTQKQPSAPQPFIEILYGILGLHYIVQQGNGITICRIFHIQKLSIQLLAIHPLGKPPQGQ